MADFAVNIILKARDDNATSTIRAVTAEYKRAFGQMGKMGRGRGRGRGVGGAIEEGSVVGPTLAPGGGRRQRDPFNIRTAGLANAMGDIGYGMTRAADMSQRALFDVMGTAKDFERAMSEVGAFGGASFEPMMDDLTAKARQLGQTTEFTAQDAANAMRVLAQAGVEPTVMMTSLDSILNSALAGATDLETSAGIVSATMAQFNEQGISAKQVSDLLATGTNITQASFRNFGQSLQYVGGAAADMGISFEDTVSLLAGMGKSALNSSRAGTSLNAMLTKLSDVAKGGDNSMKGLLKATKTSKQEFKGLLDEGNVIGALQLLVRNMDKAGFSATKQGAMIKQAFGERGARAFMSLATQMRKTEGGMAEIQSRVGKADGSAAKMAKQIGDNLTGSIRQWDSAMEEAKIELATHLGPAVRDFVDVGTTMVRGLGEWIGEHKSLIKEWGPLILKMTLAAKVAGPLLTSFAAMVRIGGDLAPILGKIGAGAGASAKTMGGLGMAAGAAGVIVAGTIGIMAELRMEMLRLRDAAFSFNVTDEFVAGHDEQTGLEQKRVLDKQIADDEKTLRKEKAEKKEIANRGFWDSPSALGDIMDEWRVDDRIARTEAALEEKRSARDRLQSTVLDPAKAQHDAEATERQRHQGKFVTGPGGLISFEEGPQQNVAPKGGARFTDEAGVQEFGAGGDQMQQMLRLQQQQLEALKSLQGGTGVTVKVDDKKTVSVERGGNAGAIG